MPEIRPGAWPWKNIVTGLLMRGGKMKAFLGPAAIGGTHEGDGHVHPYKSDNLIFK